MSARTHSGLSHEEIGKILGCSRQNVQLIERRALNKLRMAMGSAYRGKWLPYDSEGVAEPATDFRDYEALSKKMRRSGGRFDRGKQEE